MSSLVELSSRIEKLSNERSALRSAGEHAKAKLLDRALADAYEEKRAATAQHGTAEKREHVRRIAKVDERLEKELR